MRLRTGANKAVQCRNGLPSVQRGVCQPGARPGEPSEVRPRWAWTWPLRPQEGIESGSAQRCCLGCGLRSGTGKPRVYRAKSKDRSLILWKSSQPGADEDFGALATGHDEQSPCVVQADDRSERGDLVEQAIQA